MGCYSKIVLGHIKKQAFDSVEVMWLGELNEILV